MTCEVAVMNKSAVALAADSAATLTIQSVHKIYIVNKLFALSEQQPVGIMIYGNPQLLGVPWETIIKMYREQLGDKKFRTLKEYSENLISFVETANNLFPQLLQKDFFRTSLQGYYMLIKKEIDDEVKQRTQKKKITKSEIEEIVTKV